MRSPAAITPVSTVRPTAATGYGTAPDTAKDQSYVLYMLGQGELARTLLPVGELTKAEVRSQAAQLRLRTAEKPESMDVCFIARGERTRFLDARTEARPGPVVDTTGRVLGRHRGVAGFTVGQRRGLGIGGGGPRYVVGLDAATATVTVGDRAALLRDEIPIRDVHFVGSLPGRGRLLVQTARPRGGAPGRLDRDRVRLDRPTPRVAPGQVVALYDGDRVVGGGLAA